jgi:hypothetical protein
VVQCHSLAPGTEAVPIAREAGYMDWCGKSRPPPGSEPRNVYPVASRYTDYAVVLHRLLHNQSFVSQYHLAYVPLTMRMTHCTAMEHRRNFNSHAYYTRMHRITTFQLTTDRIYDGGPIRFYYSTVVLQLPSVFSTVTCCTGL